MNMVSAVLQMVLSSAIMTGICTMANVSMISEVYERSEQPDGKLFGIPLHGNDAAQFIIVMIGTVSIFFFGHMATILLYLLAYGK